MTGRVLLAAATASLLSVGMGAIAMGQDRHPEVIRLPEAREAGKVSLEKALRDRRSLRTYARDPLTLTEVSHLLWAGQGVTDREGQRTAPSAGALYPLELYLVAGNVEGLPKGLYKYRCRRHDLVRVGWDDLRSRLASAALDQDCVRKGAAVIVFSAVYERTTRKYGNRGIRYVHMEVGHAAQNVYLQAISLGLGTVFIGAFNDSEVKKVLSLPREEEPLGLMPVGRRR